MPKEHFRIPDSVFTCREERKRTVTSVLYCFARPLRAQHTHIRTDDAAPAVSVSRDAGLTVRACASRLQSETLIMIGKKKQNMVRMWWWKRNISFLLLLKPFSRGPERFFPYSRDRFRRRHSGKKRSEIEDRTIALHIKVSCIRILVHTYNTHTHTHTVHTNTRVAGAKANITHKRTATTRNSRWRNRKKTYNSREEEGEKTESILSLYFCSAQFYWVSAPLSAFALFAMSPERQRVMCVVSTRIVHSTLSRTFAHAGVRKP